MVVKTTLAAGKFGFTQKLNWLLVRMMPAACRAFFSTSGEDIVQIVSQYLFGNRRSEW